MAAASFLSPSSTPLRFSSSITTVSPSQILSLNLILRTRRSSRFPIFVSKEDPCSSPLETTSPFPTLSPALSSVAPFLLPEWRLVLGGWLCSAASAYLLSRVVVPTLSRLPSTPAGPAVIPALAAASAARAAASYFQQSLLWEAALKSSFGIRAHVFDHVLSRDLDFFQRAPAGDIAHRITAEAQDVADTLYALLNTIMPNTLQLVAMGTQMVAISPLLSIASASVIPCMLLVIIYLGGRLREISRRAHQSVARLSAYLNEVLPSMIVIKAHNGELNESLRFQRLAKNDMVERLNKRKMKALIPQIVQLIYMGGLLGIFFGFSVVSKNPIDVSSVLTFVMSLVLILEPIQGAEKAYNEWKQGEPAIERLFSLANFKNRVTDKPDAVDLYHVKGDIKFCDVTFSYGENAPLVLNRLNLHIKPGERIALIGPSGGGKTTLTKLLLRLYDPLNGHILVDDKDIQNFWLRSLREHIAFVSQDIIIFSGTVAENIGYRDPIENIDIERVKKAARVANADEFIRALPRGYETNVGQRGSLLSGGQKQRLAIARALYKESSILILDEATSALDSRSELLVRQALENLMSNRTVLVVAHRLETVLMADRVFLLDGGKLEEVPKHAILSREYPYNLPTMKDLTV